MAVILVVAALCGGAAFAFATITAWRADADAIRALQAAAAVPTEATFGQAAAAFDAVLTRPFVGEMSAADVTAKLQTFAGADLFVRVWRPAYGSPAIPYDIRIATLREKLLAARTVILYRPADTGGAFALAAVGPANGAVGNDAAVASTAVALPRAAGFAVAFVGRDARSIGGNGDFPAWHVALVDADGKTALDGPALPDVAFARSMSGLTASGGFIAPGTPDAALFSACVSCPHVERRAVMMWKDDRYVVTAADVVPTLFVSVVEYLTSATASRYEAAKANRTDLAVVRKTVIAHRDRGRPCDAVSDSTDPAGDEMDGRVEITCRSGAGDETDYTIDGVKSGGRWLLSDATAAP